MSAPSFELIQIADVLRQAHVECVAPYWGNLQAKDVISKGEQQTVTGKRQDLVTVADLAVERYVIDWYAANRPQTRIVGEEMITRHEDVLADLGKGSVGVLDPVDGTALFRAGKPGYGILFSRQENGETQAGWILRTFLDDSGKLDNEVIMADEASGAWHSPRIGAPFVRLSRPAPAASADTPSVVLSAQYFNRGVLKHEDVIYAGLKELGASIDQPVNGLKLSEHASAAQAYADLALGKVDAGAFTPTRPWDHNAGVYINRRVSAGADQHMDTGKPYDPTRIDGGIICARDSETLRVVQQRLLVSEGAPLGYEPCIWTLLIPQSQARYIAAGHGPDTDWFRNSLPLGKKEAVNAPATTS